MKALKILLNVVLVAVIFFFGLVILVAIASSDIETPKGVIATIVIIFILPSAYGFYRLNIRKVNIPEHKQTMSYFERRRYKKAQAKHARGQELQAREQAIIEAQKRKEKAHQQFCDALKSGQFPDITESAKQQGILLKKGESCIAIAPAGLWKYKTKTHYMGGSVGVSVRVMKGVSVRTGGFKGQPIKTESIEKTESLSRILCKCKIQLYML